MAEDKQDGRKLTKGEHSLANRIFNGAINLEHVCVYDYAGSERYRYDPSTRGNDIFFPPRENGKPTYFNDFFTAPVPYQGMLIHELTHVWQNQTNARRTYFPETKIISVEDYAQQLGLSLEKYLRTRLNMSVEEFREGITRHSVKDIVSRPLHATRDHSRSYQVEISTGMIDGTTRTNIMDSGDLVSLFLRDFSADRSDENKHRLSKLWADEYSHYNYLVAGWRSTAFANLNVEAQAEMVRDYFILLNGADPRRPDIAVPHTGGFRLSGDIQKTLDVYRKIIPFVGS